MPRDYDRDDDDDRRDRSSSGGKTVMIVLGVVGGLALLTILGCGGLVFYMFNSMKNTVQSVLATTSESMAFVDNLKNNRIDSAYAQMTTAYQAKTSKKQFEEWLEKNPLLTKHQRNVMTSSQPPVKGQKSGTFTFTLHERMHFGTGNDDVDDPDEPDAESKKKPDHKPKDSGPDKTITLTLKMIEENGTWKIDDATVSK